MKALKEKMFKYFKIFPLLLFVACLAFTVRLGEIAMGVWTLDGPVAFAEDAPAPPPQDALASPEAAAENAEDDAPIQFDENSDSEAAGENWVDPGLDSFQTLPVQQEILQDLNARRERMDQREKDLNMREALLRATEQELDRKLQEMNVLRGELEGLMKQQSDDEVKQIQSLVKVYEGMKAKDAARIFNTLDIEILLSVMSRMSERKLSPILAEMNPDRAREITIRLAEQRSLPELPDNQ